MTSRLLLWVDAEFCCLSPENGHIVEIAAVCTDNNLQIVGDIFHRVFKHEDCDNMSQWAKSHFSQPCSTRKTTLRQEMQTTPYSLENSKMDFINFLVKSKESYGRLMLAGSSVHVDAERLRKWLGDDNFNNHIHHRIIDISTVLELTKRWNVYCSLPKHKAAHRALDDVFDSIALLRALRLHVN